MSTLGHPHRTTPRPPGRARVTPRDLVLLQFVSEAQPVRAVDLATVSGMSLEMVRRRTRVLRDLGVLATHVVSSEVCNYYTLGRAALPHLQRVGAAEDRLHVPKGLGKVNIDHHLGAVHLHAVLLRATAAAQGPRLVEFLHERDVRRATGAGPGVNVPDAVAVLERTNGAQFAAVIEIDLGTENPSFVASTKFVPYAAMQNAGESLRGVADWFVAVVVQGERRLHRLARAAWDAGVPEGFVYLTTRPDISLLTALGDIWKTPAIDGDSAVLIRAAPFRGGRDRSPDHAADRSPGGNGQRGSFEASQLGSFREESRSFTHGSG